MSIAENPWLSGSRVAAQGDPWRTMPIPDGGGIVEYVIDEEGHRVILTRIFPFFWDAPTGRRGSVVGGCAL